MHYKNQCIRAKMASFRETCEGVIDGSWISSLFVITHLYPPRDPRLPLGPSLGSPWALLGLSLDRAQGPRSPGEPPRGPQGSPRDLSGTPQDPPRAHKDPLVSPQEAPGSPIGRPQGPPGRPKYHPKTAPKLEIQQKPTFFQCFSKCPGDTQGPLRTPQGSPKDPPRRSRDP